MQFILWPLTLRIQFKTAFKVKENPLILAITWGESHDQDFKPWRLFHYSGRFNYVMQAGLKMLECEWEWCVKLQRTQSYIAIQYWVDFHYHTNLYSFCYRTVKVSILRWPQMTQMTRWCNVLKIWQRAKSSPWCFFIYVTTTGLIKRNSSSLLDESIGWKSCLCWKIQAGLCWLMLVKLVDQHTHLTSWGPANQHCILVSACKRYSMLYWWWPAMLYF